MKDNMEEEAQKKNISSRFDMAFSPLSKFADDLPDHKPLVDYYVESNFHPKFTEWKGYKMRGLGFNANTIKWVYENWTPWKDDVIVSAFAKTGTTWARTIVNQLYYRNDAKLMAMSKLLTMPQLYLETGLPLKFEILEKLPWKKRVLSTHVPAPLINFERIKSGGAKIIYMMRNPKDQLVSWHNMTSKFPVRPSDPEFQKAFPLDWKEFFEAAISGVQYFGNKDGEYYLDHLLTWHEHRNDENVLFVVYEDMKK
uniref:Sulfotransferase n=1 Tax=Ciona savignyi TaxID=51511 RepID=H2YSQ9_CIOSA